MFDTITSEITNIINIVITAIGGILVSTNFIWVIRNLKLFKREMKINKQQIGDALIKSLPKNIKLDVSTKIEETVRPEFVKLENKLNKLIRDELSTVKHTQDGINILLTILKEFKVTKDNEALYLEIINYLDRNELTVEV